MAATRLRRILAFGVLAGVLYALWRRIGARRPAPAAPTHGPGGTAGPGVPAGISRLGESPDESPRPGNSPGDSPGESASGNESAGDSARAEISQSWVEPEDGACPVSHPVKAKLSSGIFHPPGAQMYNRTRADRCYPDAAAAEADGLRASKR
jgi:hypothetical protein